MKTSRKVLEWERKEGRIAQQDDSPRLPFFLIFIFLYIQLPGKEKQLRQ